jgi:tetratricopeptide (TPR) repeat protein
VLKIDQGCLPAYYVLGLAQLAAGRFDESVAVFETSAALHGDIFSVAHLASACGLAGQRQRAEALLAELEKRSTSQSVAPTFFATAQLGLGNNERAFDWLEKAFAEHDAHILWLRVGPHWDPLRCEPRFADLVKRLPLPPEA